MTDQSTGGLIYMQARYYDPSLGRFVSEVPSGHGANWYVYADCDPINKIDSTGKDPAALILILLIWAAVAALNDTPLTPEVVKSYISSIDMLVGMVNANNTRVYLLTTIGAEDDEAGAKTALYNAVGYGVCGILATVALYQVSLIAEMIEQENDPDD